MEKGITAYPPVPGIREMTDAEKASFDKYGFRYKTYSAPVSPKILCGALEMSREGFRKWLKPVPLIRKKALLEFMRRPLPSDPRVEPEAEQPNDSATGGDSFFKDREAEVFVYQETDSR